jgi:hypothetical protein
MRRSTRGENAMGFDLRRGSIGRQPCAPRPGALDARARRPPWTAPAPGPPSPGVPPRSMKRGTPTHKLRLGSAKWGTSEKKGRRWGRAT